MKTTNSSSEFCSSQCREHIESISRASRGFKPLFTLLLLLTFSIGNVWAADVITFKGATTKDAKTVALTPTISSTNANITLGICASTCSTDGYVISTADGKTTKLGGATTYYLAQPYQSGSKKYWKDAGANFYGTFTIPSDYTYTIKGINHALAAQGSTNFTAVISVKDATTSKYTSSAITVTKLSGDAGTITSTAINLAEVDWVVLAAGTYTINVTPTNTADASTGKYFGIAEVALIGDLASAGGGGGGCSSADATFTVTDDEIEITPGNVSASTTLNFTKGDNTNNPTFAVTKGGSATADASVSGTTFTATAAGTYKVTATQEEDGTYCEVVKEVTITVTDASVVVDCPTSGEVFSWLPKTGLSDADINAGTYDLPGNWLTSVSGGSAQLYVPSSGNMRIRGSQLAYNSGNAYIHVTMDCELQAGDVIDINSSGNKNNIWLSLSNSRPSSASNAAAVIVQGTSFVLSTTNGATLIGKKEFYAWRNSSTTQIGSLTITRPEPPCGATAPGDISKGMLSGGNLPLTAAGSPASGDTWYWQTSATGTDKTGTSGATKSVNAAGTYYIRSYNVADDCWSDAKSIIVSSADLVANYTVVYKDGNTELGSEVVPVGEHPTATGISTTKPLFTFVSWQLSGSDIALDDASWASVAANAEITLTARWAKAYATNVNFETEAVGHAGSDAAAETYAEGVVNAHNYALSTKTGTTFDDNTDSNNGAYLGLKIKHSGTTLSWNVVAGKVVEFKAGVMVANGNLSINGGAATTIDGGSTGSGNNFKKHYFYSAAEALYVFTTSNGSAEVIKAITMRDPFTVSFAAHGDADPNALQGTPSVTLPNATNGTSSLLGWFDAAEGGNKIGEVGDTYFPTANITLHAQWEDVSTDARLASITLNPSTGVLSPAFDPEVTNYTYTMPYGTTSVPQITGATANHPDAQDPVIISQASNWGQTATIRGVAQSGDTKAYNITMLRAQKDGVCIIKATHTGATTADVEGLIGGIYDKNTQSGGKLGSNGHYFGIKLAEGTFKAGDMVEIYASTTSTKVQIFSDKGTTMLDDGVFDGNYYKFTLTAATEWIYLYRTSTAGSAMNPTLGYIAVYRPMNPVLTAITIDGVDGVINEAAKKVSVQLPYTADLANLDVQPTIAWNGAAATNAIQVISNSGNWVEGNNIYRITDKDGDYSDYQITLNRAEASHDATLSELTVNGNAIALIPGQFVYEYEFPKGTPATPAPVVAAVANDSHRHSLDITQANSASGSAEIVVVAEDEKTTKTYTINFSISKWDEVVIWDGSTMSEVATSPDATGLAWEVKVKDSRFKVASYSSASYEDKGYLKYIGTGGTAANDYHFSVTIPKGYVAKLFIVFGAHSDDANGRGLFVGETISSAAIDGIYNKVSTIRNTLTGGYSELIGGNLLETKTYYINPTKSVDIYEVRVFLRRGCIREDMLGKGVLGTICVDHNVAMEDVIGASFYTLVGKEPEYGKIVFDEIISGELEAGKPYIFQADGDKLILIYGETVVSEPDNEDSALKGTFVDLPIYPEDAADVYYFRDHALWSARQTGVLIGANRAYLQMDEVNPISSPHPAPGCRRITIGVNSTNSAQGIDETEATEKPIKIMIEGQLFILRGEKRYDATGRLVK